MNAGEETVGGFSAPPMWMVNVAGIRTFVEPPAAAAARDAFADVVAVEEPVDGAAPVALPEPAPLPERAPLAPPGPAPLPEPDPLPERDPVARVALVLAELMVLVAGWDGAAAVELLEEECEAVPHAAKNRNTSRPPSAHRRRLTP